MNTRHPWDAFGGLDLGAGRDCGRVVISSALNVDDPREKLVIKVEETRAAVGAEVASAIFRGLVNFGGPTK